MTTEEPSGEELDRRIYALHRARIVEEDGLINHRMGWMLWSTSILLALWGALTAASIVRERPDDGIRLFLASTGILVASFGGLIAWQSKVSIGAAKTEVERIRDDYENMVKGKKLSPDLIGTVTGRVTPSRNPHLGGHLSAAWIPVFFMILWLVLWFGSASISLRFYALSAAK